MTSFRLLRVNELLKRVISEYLHNHFPQESVAITIIKVETSPNLRHAKVSYSVYNEEAKNSAIGFLNRVKPALNNAIRKEVRLKYSPTLNFTWDESLEKGHHILDMLHHLEEPKDLSAGPKE